MLARPQVEEAFRSAARCGIVLVAAPAGYGKSVALAHHLAKCETRGLLFDVRADSDVGGLLHGLGTIAGWEVGVARIEPALHIHAARLLCDRIAEAGFGWVALEDVATASPSLTRFLSELLALKARFRWYVVTRDAEQLDLGVAAGDGRLGRPIDANVLAFTTNEVEALVRDGGAAEDRMRAGIIHAETGGWPVAVAHSIATRTSDESATPPFDSFERYVRERIVPALEPAERDALAWSPYVPLHARVLERLGIDDACRILDGLRRIAPYVPATDDAYAIHPALAKVAASQESLRPASERQAKWRRAGDAFRALGDDGAALRAHLAGEDREGIVALLRARGDVLSERGFGALVTRALGVLPTAIRRSVPELSLLDASAETERGRKDIAEDLLRAVAESGGAAARTARVRLATALVNRGKPGGADVLRALALAHPCDAEVQSAFAVALAAMGDRGELAAVSDAGARAARHCDDELTAARSWQRLALAAHFCGEYATARDRCNLALEIAAREGFHGVAARIRSITYSIAVALDDDAGAFAEATAMAAAARRGGLRQIEIAGLTALLVRAAELGDERAFADADASFAGLGPVRGYADAFPHAFARAMGDVRRGRVSSASAGLHRILAEKEEPPDILACAHAIAALLAIANDSAAARPQLDGLRRRAADIDVDARAATSHTMVVTHAVSAILEATHGRRAFAARSARRALRTATNRRERALAQAAYAFATAESRHAWSVALASLESAGLGGYAALFRLVAPPEHDTSPSILSASEREILTLYAQRLQAKEIADRLDRNVCTVRTHIRNGTRKLGVRGREDLIARLGADSERVHAPT